MKNTVIKMYNELKNKVCKESKFYMYNAAGVKLEVDSNLIYLVYNKEKDEIFPYINISGTLYYFIEHCKNLYIDINNEESNRLFAMFDPGNIIKDNITDCTIKKFNNRSNDKIVGVFTIDTGDLLYMDSKYNSICEECECQDDMDEFIDKLLGLRVPMVIHGVRIPELEQLLHKYIK